MHSGSDNDEEMLARIREHDEGALQRLLRKYQRKLGDFSHSILRSRDLADEAVSNVFLNIWRRRERLAIKSTVRSYLFAATGNQSFKLWRDRKRRAGVWLDDVPARHLVEPRSIAGDIQYRELQDQVEALVAQLPPQRQIVFRLNRLEGFSYGEIARALELSERTVQNHMTQATRQLGEAWPSVRRSLGRSEAKEARPAGRSARVPA